MLDVALREIASTAKRVADFALYRDYHEGRHRFGFASKRFRETNEWILKAATENLMPAVVNVFADKITVEDWGVGEDGPVSIGALDRLAALVHNEALVTGNAFVLVWRDPTTGAPVPAFQRTEQCVPIVDPERPDVLQAFAKVWIDTDRHARLNLYDARGLTRWRTTNKGMPATPDVSAWQPYEADGVPHEEAHDFGAVPALWFKRDAPHPLDWGVSVLRDCIPAQDILNKGIADTLAASERVAMPLRYVMDVAPELLTPKLNRETGKLEPPKLPFDERVNGILALTAKGPAGQFASPDAASLIALQAEAQAKIARVSGIPLFYFTQGSNDAPSGASLRVISSRLSSSVQAFARDNTPVWEGLLRLLGVKKPAIKWADPLPLSDEERIANALAEKDLGLPAEQYVATAGYDPAKVQAVPLAAQAGVDVYGA